MMILNSESQNKDINMSVGNPRLVVVLDIKDKNEATIIVPIELALDESKTHFMLSAFPQIDTETKLPKDKRFQEQVDLGNLRYINRDKAKRLGINVPVKKYKMMESVGAKIKWRRRPSSVSARIPSRKKIIYTEKALVNLRAERGNTQYQTQQQHIQGSYDAINNIITILTGGVMDRMLATEEEIEAARVLKNAWRFVDFLKARGIPDVIVKMAEILENLGRAFLMKNIS